MALRARAHRLLLRQLQERPSWRRMIYSIDGVFESHLKEDTVRRVEAHWRPRLASTLPKVPCKHYNTFSYGTVNFNY